MVSGVGYPGPVDMTEGVLDFYADPVGVSSTCTPWGAISSSFVMVRLPTAQVHVGLNGVVDVWFCIKSGSGPASCGDPGSGVLRIDAKDGITMAGALCGSKAGDQVGGTFTVPDCFR